MKSFRQLINDALTNNYDLRQAVARIDAARANLGITRSEQFPSIIASGDVINQRQSRSGSFDFPEPIKRDRSFGSVLLNLLTFELDIWGRLRKQTAAARADLFATEEARRSSSLHSSATLQLPISVCVNLISSSKSQDARSFRAKSHCESSNSGNNAAWQRCSKFARRRNWFTTQPK